MGGTKQKELFSTKKIFELFGKFEIKENNEEEKNSWLN